MFVPVKPFQPSSQVRPMSTQVKHISGAPPKGKLVALPTNIRLGWKSLPGSNNLAYYENSINNGQN
jgi:hypothetical protein